METTINRPRVFNLNRETKTMLALITAAFVLKMIYFWYYYFSGNVPYADFQRQLGDSAIYRDLAQAIANGDFWRQIQYFGRESVVFYRSPLYPFVVAFFFKIFGQTVLPIYIFQLLVGSFNLLLIYLIARRLFSHPAGVVAVALAALYAPLTFKEAKLVSVTLTIAFGLLTVIFLLKSEENRPRRHWFVAGIFAGLATLTWGGMIFLLPVLFVVWLLLRPRRPFSFVILFGFGWFAAVLPATLHNILIGNDWVLINSNSGYTFYQGNNPAASGTIIHPPEVYDTLALRLFRGRYPTNISDQQHFDLIYAATVIKRTNPARANDTIKPSEASSFWLRRGLTWIMRNPGHFLRNELEKLQLSLTNYEFPSNYFIAVEQNRVPVLRVFFIPFAVIFALGILGIIVSFGNRLQNWPLYILLLAGLLVLLVFYAGSRYRLPMVPPLIVFAGAGLWNLVQQWRNRKLALARIAIVAVGLLVSSVFTSVPVAKRYAFTTALGYRNLGESWLAPYRQGEIEIPGNHVESRRALNKSLSIFEENRLFDLTPVAAEALADIYRLQGDAWLRATDNPEQRGAALDSSIQNYRSSLLYGPPAPSKFGKLAFAFLQRAEASRFEQKDYRSLLDSARSYARLWRSTDSLAADPVALEGDIELAAGDTAKALDIYRLLSTIAPGFEPVYRLMIAIYLQKADTNRALETYHTLLRVDSTNVFANLGVGDIYLARRETTQATLRYEHAAAADTFALLPPLKIALVHATMGRHAEAAEVLRRAVHRVETNSRFRNAILRSVSDATLYSELKLRLSLALMNLGKWDEAAQQASGVLEFAPNHRTASQLLEAARQHTVPSFVLW